MTNISQSPVTSQVPATILPPSAREDDSTVP